MTTWHSITVIFMFGHSISIFFFLPVLLSFLTFILLVLSCWKLASKDVHYPVNVVAYLLESMDIWSTVFMHCGVIKSNILYYKYLSQIEIWTTKVHIFYESDFWSSKIPHIGLESPNTRLRIYYMNLENIRFFSIWIKLHLNVFCQY